MRGLNTGFRKDTIFPAFGQVSGRLFPFQKVYSRETMQWRPGMG